MQGDKDMSDKQLGNVLRMVGVKLDGWQVKVIIDQVSPLTAQNFQ